MLLMDIDHVEEPPAVGPADLTLRLAAERARCSVKTLRRAIDKGDLPKRYAVGENGPQLVVTPDELEAWMDCRVSTPPPLDKIMSHGQSNVTEAQLSIVSTLQAAIDHAVHSAIEPLVQELGATRMELGDTREQLGAARAQADHLAAQLAAFQGLDGQAAATNKPVPTIPVPETIVGRPHASRWEKARAALIRALS